MKIRRDAFFRLRVRAHALALEERRQQVVFKIEVVAELYRILARELNELEADACAFWDAVHSPEEPPREQEPEAPAP